MIKILSLFLAIGVIAASNGSRDFFFTIGVLKEFINAETDLIRNLLNQITHQQQQLKEISNVEHYSRELMEVSRKARQHLLGAGNTVDMLNELESLWHKVDNFVEGFKNNIGLDNVTSSVCNSKFDVDDFEYGVFTDYAQMLCKGMIPLSKDVEKHLRCRFVDHGNPFLKIAPFKQEDVYLEPHIVIYHNVLTDEEIDKLQEEAYPMLETAIVRSIEDGSHESKIRVAENAWLDEEDHKYIKSINRRAEQMTNLYGGTAENLQVAYYKSGGYFNEHTDFDPDENNPFPHLAVGNRIGTLMFYLNNVQEGGKTIFTDLNVTLTPKKGNAVFWYNVLPSGDLDFYTLHAGCRVVSGVKWVANKWFHERGQEFFRPCTLTRNPDYSKSLHYTLLNK